MPAPATYEAFRDILFSIPEVGALPITVSEHGHDGRRLTPSGREYVIALHFNNDLRAHSKYAAGLEACELRVVAPTAEGEEFRVQICSCAPGTSKWPSPMEESRVIGIGEAALRSGKADQVATAFAPLVRAVGRKAVDFAARRREIYCLDSASEHLLSDIRKEFAALYECGAMENNSVVAVVPARKQSDDRQVAWFPLKPTPDAQLWFGVLAVRDRKRNRYFVRAVDNQAIANGLPLDGKSIRDGKLVGFYRDGHGEFDPLLERSAEAVVRTYQSLREVAKFLSVTFSGEVAAEVPAKRRAPEKREVPRPVIRAYLTPRQQAASPRPARDEALLRFRWTRSEQSRKCLAKKAGTEYVARTYATYLRDLERRTGREAAGPRREM